MYLSLIVKGDRIVALNAASNRGIPLTIKNEVLNFYGALTETIAITDVQHRDKVAAWFGEAPINAPYPNGTLLHFYERE